MYLSLMSEIISLYLGEIISVLEFNSEFIFQLLYDKDLHWLTAVSECECVNTAMPRHK